VYSVAAAFSAGIDTVGALPNVPVADTTLFEATVGPLGDADADAEEDAAGDFDADDADDEDDDEDDDDDAQPAAAAAASMGIMRSAAARRMRTSRVGQADSLQLRPRLSASLVKRLQATRN